MSETGSINQTIYTHTHAESAVLVAHPSLLGLFNFLLNVRNTHITLYGVNDDDNNVA